MAKEYIEREAAIRELLNDAPEQVFYSREDAADCIRYIPAADVAPVVLCKDCKWYLELVCGESKGWCSEVLARPMPSNGFCSFGERENNG